MSKSEFSSLLRACWPLHPLVAVTLGNVFRKLAQNERSAFSFLFSSEPFGVREFADSGAKNLYGIDRLYDYLNYAVRDGLFASSSSKTWAEIETVLRSNPDANEADAFLIKTVGLINAVGQSGKVRTTGEILQFAATDTPIRVKPQAAIKRLMTKRLLVNRKFNSTFALWEGSDVDLEKEIRIARDKLDPQAQSTASLASRFFKPRPIVARRHSFVTGALKYFPLHFVDVSLNKKELDAIEGPAIVVLLSERSVDEKKALAFAKSASIKKREDVVCCVPVFREGFGKGIRDLACLEWVDEHVDRLEGDRTARRELSIQIEGVRSKLHQTFDGILSTGSFASDSAQWFFAGKKKAIKTGRAFQEELSNICDVVYPEAPTLLNELINRRLPSSQSAAARNKLIEHMIEESDTPELGITGTPPEMSMYRSLLLQTGIHAKDKAGAWRFAKPGSKANSGVRAVWKEIEKFLNSTLGGPKTIEQLYQRLKAPPYGMLDGPLPVFACAALLAFENEIALYREGSFIPVLNAPEFELIIKSPSKYSFQKWKVTGVRATVFQQLAKLVGSDIPGKSIGKPEILQIVRPLISFAKSLNEYTQRSKSLSSEAVTVRDLLLKASMPDQLIFVDLPKACGIRPFKVNTKPNSKTVEKFITKLRQHLDELQRCYENLLGKILVSIRAAFELKGDVVAVRKNLVHRAAILGECRGDTTLKNFVRNVIQKDLSSNEWLEAIASSLAIKPPPKWKALDEEKFEQSLANVARLFRHMESLSFGTKKLPESDVAIRVGVTEQDASEAEKVVSIPRSQLESAEKLKAEIRKFIGTKGRKNKKLLTFALGQLLKEQLD